MDLPSHIPIRIETKEIEKVRSIFQKLGYEHTFFQIQKPRQSFGLVKEIQYKDRIVDHHVRCYQNGTITTEIELPRLKEMWLHLTSHSISAHEYVIEILEEAGIEYDIDIDLKNLFAEFGPTEFKRDYLEFLRWFFYGVCFWVPVAYIWRFSMRIKSFFRKGDRDHANTSTGNGSVINYEIQNVKVKPKNGHANVELPKNEKYDQVEKKSN